MIKKGEEGNFMTTESALVNVYSASEIPEDLPLGMKLAARKRLANLKVTRTTPQSTLVQRGKIELPSISQVRSPPKLMTFSQFEGKNDAEEHKEKKFRTVLRGMGYNLMDILDGKVPRGLIEEMVRQFNDNKELDTEKLNDLDMRLKFGATIKNKNGRTARTAEKLKTNGGELEDNFGDLRPRATVSLDERFGQIIEARDRGLTTKEIADELGLSINTVQAYITKLVKMGKLSKLSKDEILKRKNRVPAAKKNSKKEAIIEILKNAPMVTQDSIALKLGIHRVTVNRYIQELRREGKIKN